MTNPFKPQYRITEYKNENGQSKFVATFCSAFGKWVNDHLERCNIYIYAPDHGSPELKDFEIWGKYDSLEGATKAVDKYKKQIIDIQKSEYKKTAIHYP